MTLAGSDLSSVRQFVPCQHFTASLQAKILKMTIIAVTHHCLALAALLNDFCFHLRIVFYFSSCYLHPMMFQFITSLTFEIITLNQIKLKQPPTVWKYLCFCGWMLVVADPAGRQCERPNETWCLSSWLLTFRLPRWTKRNLLNMVYLHSSDDKPLSPLASSALCNICFNTGTCQLQIKLNSTC